MQFHFPSPIVSQLDRTDSSTVSTLDRWIIRAFVRSFVRPFVLFGSLTLAASIAMRAFALDFYLIRSLLQSFVRSFFRCVHCFRSFVWFVHLSIRSINRSFRSVPSVHWVASVRSVAASMSVRWFVHVFVRIVSTAFVAVRAEASVAAHPAARTASDSYSPRVLLYSLVTQQHAKDAPANFMTDCHSAGNRSATTTSLRGIQISPFPATTLGALELVAHREGTPHFAHEPSSLRRARGLLNINRVLTSS